MLPGASVRAQRLDTAARRRGATKRGEAQRRAETRSRAVGRTRMRSSVFAHNQAHQGTTRVEALAPSKERPCERLRQRSKRRFLFLEFKRKAASVKLSRHRLNEKRKRVVHLWSETHRIFLRAHVLHLHAQAKPLGLIP